MWNRYKRIFFSLLFTLFFCISSVQAQNVEINIYSINDFHGALRPRVDAPGISILAGAMQQLTTNSSNNIIVAAGDLFGTTTDARDTDGISTVIAMNKLGVACISIGNHEFDYTPDKVSRQMQVAEFPFMAANISSDNNKFQKYKIVTRDGIKIAIIGMITPDTQFTTTKMNITGIKFAAPDAVLADYIRAVRAQGAQIVVLLAHIGSNQTQSGEIQGEITKLLDNVPGLDAVITGHTHQLVAGVYNNTPVVQAKCYGQAIAQLKITYSTEQNKVIKIEPKTIEITKNNFAPDIEMGRFIQTYLDSATSKYSTTIAINEQALFNNRFHESTIANYFLDMLRINTKSDIVMLNAGAVRKDYIAKGPFSIANLIDIFPFANHMVKLNIKGKYILEALNYGIAHPKYGFLRTSGLIIQYDSRLPVGKQILSATLTNGKRIQDETYYTLVIPDFMFDGGDGYNMFKNYKRKEILAEITDIILVELKKKPHIIYTEDNRVTNINK